MKITVFRNSYEVTSPEVKELRLSGYELGQFLNTLRLLFDIDIIHSGESLSVKKDVKMPVQGIVYMFHDFPVSLKPGIFLSGFVWTRL